MREERGGGEGEIPSNQDHETTRCSYVPSSRHPTLFAISPTNEFKELVFFHRRREEEILLWEVTDQGFELRTLVHSQMF